MKMMKKTLAVLTALICLSAAACSKMAGTPIPDLESSLNAPEAEEKTEAAGVQTVSEKTAAAEAVKLTKTDLDTSWSDSDVSVVFSGKTVTPSVTDGIEAANGVLTIRKGGTYVLSGTLEDGRVVVDLTDASEKVHLVFNGVSVSSGTDAPLSILSADKAVITLAENTENRLSDTAEGDGQTGDAETAKACISSKCDLTVNGTGSLTVSAKGNNGIHCKDDLKIVSGTVQVEAANHGIRGNDSVLINSGIVSVKAGGDGIKTSTQDKENKGMIAVWGGDVTVVSGQDGLDAATDLLISGGILEIESGGGTANAEPHRTEGGRSQMNGGSTAEQSAEETPSRKGIKAASGLALTGGTITVDAADDAVHTDGAAGIGGSTVLTVRSGDDGIHADQQLLIDGEASVTVSESYEGIESREVQIAGGVIRVTASDDGINAAGEIENSQKPIENTAQQGFGGRGGFGMNGNSTGDLTVSGGYLYVNAGGDGLDSNGDITVTGGTVIVCGPTNDGNGPLDCGDRQNTIKVTGGTLMAVGSTGMMDVPEANYIASAELNAAAGTLIAVTDADGTVLGILKTPKKAAGIVFSANGMTDGYSIYSGGTYDGTLNDDGFGTGGSYTGGTLVKSGSGGSGSGFGFGRFGGQMPEFSDGQMPDFSDGQIPDFSGGQRPDFSGGETPKFSEGERPEGGSGRRAGGRNRSASDENSDLRAS